VQAVCSRVLILREGRVLHQAQLDHRGATQSIPRYRVRLERPPGLAALGTLPGVAAAQQLDGEVFRLTLRPGERVTALSRHLAEADWGLAELTPERTDLDQVFFDILRGEQGTDKQGSSEVGA
jgi:ABC-type uncharacterized transport system ATPase subunit